MVEEIEEKDRKAIGNVFYAHTQSCTRTHTHSEQSRSIPFNVKNIKRSKTSDDGTDSGTRSVGHR